MAVTYSAEPSDIRPYEFPDSVLLDIGKIVRSCAEIEDIINLYLGELAVLTEGHVAILLGRTAISQKLKMLQTFSGASGPEAEDIFKDCFEHESFTGLIRFRNTVAHGLLLGLTDDDRIAFRVAELVGAEPSAATLAVQSYGEEDIKYYAKLATAMIPYLEKRLKLKALREKRRQRSLDPHRKSQPRAQQNVKRERQPPASPE